MENKENITDYARRMRELAGLSENAEKKTLSGKQFQEEAAPSKQLKESTDFEEGQTFYAKDMMVPNKEEKKPGELDINGNIIPASLPSIKENFDSEEFIPNGSYTVSNAGGYEIMLSDSGDAAKVRDAYGSDNPETSDWLEIEYITDEEGESNPVIDPSGYNIPLNQVMRINENKTPESNSDEFRTHKFEQKSIEEGTDDEELYTLNEDTIIVLDFLNEEVEEESSDASVRHGKDRKGPTDSATWHDAGTVKKGEDGNMWKIVTGSNGVNRWVEE